MITRVLLFAMALTLLVAAGSAAGPGTYMRRGICPTLAAGCISPKVQGHSYSRCGDTWSQPSCRANGVSYRLVPTP